MPFTDDILGTIFPTRNGGSIGASEERGMMPKDTGASGFRTRVLEQRNGDTVTTTTLRTKDGMPQFTTETIAPPSGTVTIPVYSSIFRAVPSSDIHLSGYTPDGYPGTVCEWADWHKRNGPPAAAGVLPAPNGELTPMRAVDGAGGAHSNVVGNTTWFSDLIKLNGEHVIVSWRTGGIRSGRYGKTLESGARELCDMTEYNRLPSFTPDLKLTEDNTRTDHSDVGVAHHVWINGIYRVIIPNAPSSAGIRAKAGSPGEYELVVMVGFYLVQVGTIPLFSTVSGETVINPALDGMTLSMTTTAYNSLQTSAAETHCIQPPFLNSDCSKAVTILDVFVDPTNASSGVYEINIATAERHCIFPNTLVVDGINISSTGAQLYEETGEYHGTIVSSYTDNHTATSQEKRVTTQIALAADFKGNDLVYLYSHRVTRQEGGDIGVFNISAVTNSAYISDTDRNMSHLTTVSINETMFASPNSVSIIHNMLGEVVVEGGDYPCYKGNQIKTGTRTGTDSGVGSGISFSESNIISTNLSEVILNTNCTLFNADLRHDAFAFSMTIDRDAYDRVSTLSGGSITHTHRLYSVVGISIFGNYIYREEVNISTPTSDVTALGAGSFGSYGFSSGSGAFQGITPTWNFTAPHYETADVSEMRTSELPALVPLYCHLAVSTDGKAAYVDLKCSPDGEGYVGKTAFVINGNVHNVTGYAPGTHVTLASPIFLPKIKTGTETIPA